MLCILRIEMYKVNAVVQWLAILYILFTSLSFSSFYYFKYIIEPTNHHFVLQDHKIKMLIVKTLQESLSEKKSA